MAIAQHHCDWIILLTWLALSKCTLSKLLPISHESPVKQMVLITIYIHLLWSPHSGVLLSLNRDWREMLHTWSSLFLLLCCLFIHWYISLMLNWYLLPSMFLLVGVNFLTNTNRRQAPPSWFTISFLHKRNNSNENKAKKFILFPFC